jgi:hypothetical protein
LDDLKEAEDTGSWRRTLRISLFEELSLEEAMDLSQDRLLLDLTGLHGTPWRWKKVCWSAIENWLNGWSQDRPNSSSLE